MKPQWETITHTLEWLKLKPLAILSVGGYMEELERSCAAGRNEKCTLTLESSLAVC